ncbi:hypothetical protein MMPV_008796 [Pyropia vietnamensis]
MRLPPPPSPAAVAAGEPGVGVFFYPAASEVKTAAFAAGTLGETVTPLHDVRVQTARALAGRRRAEAELLLWGAGGTASLVRSAVVGVSDGYAVTLRLDGTGFRVESKMVEVPPMRVAVGGEGGTTPAVATPAAAEEVVVLRIGFANVHTLPAVDPVTGVRLIVLGPQALQVAGIDHQAVHQMAAKVRALRPAARDPYKNKGIRYEGEPLRKKESKKDS